MFLGIDNFNDNTLALKDNENHSITYGELCDCICRFPFGESFGSTCLCLCKNTVGSVLGYLALIENNIIPILIGSSTDKHFIIELLNVYRPKYIWQPMDMHGEFQGEMVYSAFDYEMLGTENESYAVHKDLELLMCTSGSTGSPKFVRYKKGNLEANARNVSIAFGWSSSERPICDLGMHYTMGLNVINTHLYVGATVLLTTYNLMTSDFWDYIKAEQATNFTGVPFSYDILHRLRFEKMDLPYLTTLSQGGGKLTDDMFRRFAEYADKNRKRFIASFGTTETAARMAVLPPELVEKTGSIGYAIPESELFLIDDNGEQISTPNTEGELCYRGPNVTMGYASCISDLAKGDEWNGEYHTGDLAVYDPDGCYYITGRKSRFLKLLGHRVSLERCERILSEEYGTDFACTGNDKQMVVYMTDDNLKTKVPYFLSEKTGLYSSLFCTKVIDCIPRNESGKIMYKSLEAADGR